MKTNTPIWIMILGIGLFGQVAQAQFDKIKNAKEQIASTTKSDQEENQKSQNPKTEKMDENSTGTSINASALEPGKGYFYTSFKSNDYKSEVGIGDELFVRMELGKTMIELAQEKGLEVSSWAYGYLTIFIDGEKVFVTKPWSFASNISKQWKYINIPLNVSPDFISKLESDQSMLETEQDIWVFQQLFQENSIVKKYTEAAMSLLVSGNHTLKAEFGLSSSDSEKEPQMVACSGEVKITADAAGAEALAMNGPKHLRPLSENEKGNFVCTSQAFTIGSGELSVNMVLPQAPKYYNMKWCQASSCDYDHGNIEFYVSIDNTPLAAWSSTLEGNDYMSEKSFGFIVLPKTDAGIGTFEASFNRSKLFKSENPVAYALFDLIYSGNLKAGKHQLKIKAYSPQSIPLNTAYEFEDAYFSQWPAIAETTIELNVTEDGRASLINSSEATKLTHAGGEWVAVDNQLKNANTGNSSDQIIDVATTSQWKVVTNSLGAILYRECKANVVYKSIYGVRLQKSVTVKQDYMGGESYGTAYFVDRIEFMHGPSLLNSSHVPVPESKVK